MISVVIPTHSRVGLLQRAVQSVLQQSHGEFELIVINDGSEDKTAVYLESISARDSRVRYYNFEHAKGACYARNFGAQRAKGKLLTFLDDDDEFHPHRLATLMDAYQPHYAYVSSALCYIKKNHRMERRFPPRLISQRHLCFQNQIGVNILVARDKFLDIAGFDVLLASSQDHDLLLWLHLRFGDAYCVQDVTMTMHTEHELPRITQSANKYRGYWAFYQKHKPLFTQRQRAFHIYKLKSYRHRAIPLTVLLAGLPDTHVLEVIRYQLGRQLPSLKEFYERYALSK